MIREIVIYGHPVLRKKGKRIDEVTDEIRTLAEDMIETMHDAHGVGLAAQQIGEAIQLTVIDVSDAENRPSRMWIDGQEVDPNEHMPLILLNPQLELSRETEIGPEGCLSFPEVTSEMSRAVQHETDHLNGILFIDRMSSAAKVTLGSKLKKLAAGER
jgi:peptide deformylase